MAIDKSKMTKYRNGKKVREPKNEIDGSQKFYWWKTKDKAAKAREIASTILFISRHQSTRLEQLTVSTRLYGNTSAFNLVGTAFTRANSVNSNPSSQRLTFNLCQSVIDTLVSKIAKDKVIPIYLTQGGVWEMQKKAKNLTKFTEGCFYQNKVHEKRTIAFRDACVWGDGLVHIFEDLDKEEICVERVLPHELLVDMIESLSQKPRQMHRVKVVDREILMAMFPDEKDIISVAIPSNYVEIGGTGTAVDMVTVTESWHLPSKKYEDEDPNCDGEHVICIGDDILFEEKWYKDYFPFAKISWSERLLGFFGQGLCEQLQNLQGEINRLMILVQRSMWMGGSFKVLLENGSKVVSQHVNNDVGSIIHYTGTPPQYITPPVIQPEIVSYIDNLIDKGYRQAGLSQMTASGMKPQGLDSGRALREMTNIEDDRYMSVEQAVEAFDLEIGRQMIEVAKDIYKRKKTYQVTFPTSKFMETIDWKEINLEADQYILKAFPRSSLPEEPAARLQTIQEYMQAGIISPKTGRRLMDSPDIEMSEDLANADEDLLHSIIEDIIHDGKYTPPEPHYNLPLAKQLVVQYMNYAQLNKCPESKMNKLRDFLKQVNDLLGIAQPQAPMPGQGQPMANPQATPASPMIQNTNNQPPAA